MSIHTFVNLESFRHQYTLCTFKITWISMKDLSTEKM